MLGLGKKWIMWGGGGFIFCADFVALVLLFVHAISNFKRIT